MAITHPQRNDRLDNGATVIAVKDERERTMSNGKLLGEGQVLAIETGPVGYVVWNYETNEDGVVDVRNGEYGSDLVRLAVKWGFFPSDNEPPF